MPTNVSATKNDKLVNNTHPLQQSFHSDYIISQQISRRLGQRHA